MTRKWYGLEKFRSDSILFFLKLSIGWRTSIDGCTHSAAIKNMTSVEYAETLIFMLFAEIQITQMQFAKSLQRSFMTPSSLALHFV